MSLSYGKKLLTNLLKLDTTYRPIAVNKSMTYYSQLTNNKNKLELAYKPLYKANKLNRQEQSRFISVHNTILHTANPIDLEMLQNQLELSNKHHMAKSKVLSSILHNTCTVNTIIMYLITINNYNMDTNAYYTFEQVLQLCDHLKVVLSQQDMEDIYVYMTTHSNLMNCECIQ